VGLREEGKGEIMFICPCCGYDGLEVQAFENAIDLPVPEEIKPPYSLHFGIPSYEVCNCCGFEFGNDDEPGAAEPESFRSYLNNWIVGGARWFDPALQPLNWSLQAQLNAARILFLSDDL
jgi:hypothetical protein